MSEEKKFKRRSACWQVVYGDKDIDVIHDGVAVSCHDAENLDCVALILGHLVEHTVRAMKDNNAKHLILQASWE